MKPWVKTMKTFELLKQYSFQNQIEKKSKPNQTQANNTTYKTLKDSIWLRKQKFRWQTLPS